MKAQSKSYLLNIKRSFILKSFAFLLILIALGGCEEDPIPSTSTPTPLPKAWEKFIGDYKVYDTVGNYLYDLQISHLPSNKYGADTIICVNFADTFNLRFQYQNHHDERYFEIGVHHPIYDFYNNRWHLSGKRDDVNTPKLENTLINDTIIFYFKMDNIAFYIYDGTPYYSCNCKHVAVKMKTPL